MNKTYLRNNDKLNERLKEGVKKKSMMQKIQNEALKLLNISFVLVILKKLERVIGYIRGTKEVNEVINDREMAEEKRSRKKVN